jgi:RNA polymerase sigma-70 factor (ECF subfamily)
VEDDQELVERILRGDERAFHRLVERYHDKIFRLVRGIVGDWHQSEDVCQEVFVLIYRKLSSFRQHSRFSTWLYRVAVNAALRARKRWRGSGLGKPLTQEHLVSAASENEAPAFEGDEVLRKLLAPLPAKLKTALVLREVGGLSYDEVARVLGCSRGAVEQRLHRALALLREVWKESDWL